MAVTLTKWTIDEYHRLIEAEVLVNKRVELLKGEIVEMPPEGEPHAQLSNDSGNYLVRLLGNRATIRHAKPITLPNQSEPEPDIAVVEPLGKEYRAHHPYPKNIFWVVEYSNTTLRKDIDVKTKVYAEAGIPEYWVVDLKNQSLIAFRSPQEGQYTSRQNYTSGSITPLAFPDICIKVGDIID